MFEILEVSDKLTGMAALDTLNKMEEHLEHLVAQVVPGTTEHKQITDLQRAVVCLKIQVIAGGTLEVTTRIDVPRKGVLERLWWAILPIIRSLDRKFSQ